MWVKNSHVYARSSDFAGYEILEQISPFQLRAEYVTNHEMLLYQNIVRDRVGDPSLEDERLAIEVYKFKTGILHNAHPINLVSHDNDSYLRKIKKFQIIIE